MCISFAPASRIRLTMRFDVVPRTMLSSTKMTRLPATVSFTTFSFIFTEFVLSA